MSMNTTQITSHAFRAVSDPEFRATIGRIGSLAIKLAKELTGAVAQLRELRQG